MAISQVGSATSAGDASGGSITITKPTGVASGDVLIATLTHNNQSPTVPSGWTLDGTQEATATGNAFWCSMAYKVAGGSEPANYNFTYPDTSAGAPFFGSITAWRGVETSGDPIGGVTSTSSGNAGEPHSSPAITANTANDGRGFYARHTRSSGSPAATISQSSATGGITELIDGGQSSGSGGTRYQHAVWMRNADFTGGSDPAAISSTASATETDSIWVTWTLVAAIPQTNAPATVASATAAAYNPSSLTASCTASFGAVTATAYDITSQTGVAAEATTHAAATATAYNAAGWVIHPVDVGAVAFNASIVATTNAGYATATVSAANQVGYFGAPPSRSYKILAESRTLDVPNETRSYGVT